MAATSMRLGWQNLLLVLTVLPSCRSLQVSIPQEEYEAVNGEDITMICSFIPAKPDFKLLVLTWEAYPDDIEEPMKTVATFFLNNPVDISPAYEGRATLEVDVARQQSTLHLTKLTVKDSRNFQCSVRIPNDDEGTTAASTSLLVLVAPSAPLCRLQGTAEYWHNINLTCVSEEGSPKPSYAWKSYNVENRPRPYPPKTTEKNGVLSLFNISRETSGFFICASTNRVGSASCNFTLAVMPASSNMGATAGIIGGVLAGLLVLGIVVYCFCKKRGKKDKNAKGEMEFSDKDAAEAVRQYRDEESSGVTEKAEYKDAVPQNTEDQHSGNNIERENNSGDGAQRYQDPHRGSRDHLDEKHSEVRKEYGGSSDPVDEQLDRNGRGGPREHLDNRGEYRGSRDRLDDQRERYGGSRDRLDDRREHYSGSRDRLDEQRNRHSRDRLDDQRDRYGGSRDCLEERNQYRGSRDRLDEPRDRYGGSRDRLDDTYDC
ncbi:cell surface A33 antigen [Nerophis ophidion]|uniref:cell surface A33 antigen n=1 Tax=Nerophis ophidion TaxID=159077 RepID=UPI002ADF1C71|nr:cell surface A33 antigen [Nerophis ophidion]